MDLHISASRLPACFVAFGHDGQETSNGIEFLVDPGLSSLRLFRRRSYKRSGIVESYITIAGRGSLGVVAWSSTFGLNRFLLITNVSHAANNRR